MILLKAGIWQGRFQYVHNGHYYIFRKELPKFDQQFITIVNPNPCYPAYSNFARFNDNRNPFNYFQRMLLWKKIADNENMFVTIVPCWHARYKIALENDFLPSSHNRYWIIPISQDDTEEDKAKDLKKKGEKIHNADFEKENAEYARISATMIRRSISNDDESYKKYIPECICSLTENLFRNIDNNEYFVVPFIDDKIDVNSIQTAIEYIDKSYDNSFILFVLTVHVSNGETEWKDENSQPWWFKPARHPNGIKTFYKRTKVIEELMKELNITNYLVTPIFIMNEDFDMLSDYNSAFLPSINNMRIIINDDLSPCENYKYNFLPWIDNIDAEDNVIRISSDKLVDENLLNFFSYSKYKNYIMGNDNVRKIKYNALIETSIEDSKHLVDEFIDKKRKDYNNGGLYEPDRIKMLNLIDSILPNIKVKYLTELDALRINSDFVISDSQIIEVEQKIMVIKKRLKEELEIVENQYE